MNYVLCTHYLNVFMGQKKSDSNFRGYTEFVILHFFLCFYTVRMLISILMLIIIHAGVSK